MKPTLKEDHPILAQIVEEELAPYRLLLSPELFEHIRRDALVQLSAHPYSAALIRQLSPDPKVKESGTLGAEWEDGEEGAAGDGDRRSGSGR